MNKDRQRIADLVVKIETAERLLQIACKSWEMGKSYWPNGTLILHHWLALPSDWYVLAKELIQGIKEQMGHTGTGPHGSSNDETRKPIQTDILYRLRTYQPFNMVVANLLTEAADKIEELQNDIECYEGMKKGVTIRIDSLDRELKETRDIINKYFRNKEGVGGSGK